MGQGYIYGKRKDHFFSDLAYQAKIPDLIEQGYLARIVSYQVADETIIDASKAKLKFKGGDYKESDLQKLQSLAKHKNCELLTTEKDYLRIKKSYRKNLNFLKVELLVDQEKHFYKYLSERL